MNNDTNSSYAASGVDINAGYETIKRIRPSVESTYIKGVLGTLGGFGGMFEPDFSGMSRPVLVSGADGVGTKLKIAFLMDKHDTVGIDCVAMCVNDIVCSGAMPLFFLDYLAVGKNIVSRSEAIVAGVSEGCRQAGCALVGGETAEMPGFYPEKEYDLAGFAVGMVDHDKIIDGKGIKSGDTLIGLASSGLHSNGYSLVRRVFGVTESELMRYMPELSCTLGEELLRPTKIYVKAVRRLLKHIEIKGVSHITGGGFIENVPRAMPANITAVIESGSFPIHPVFELIATMGKIPVDEMFNTFNMGIGLVIAVDKKDVGTAMEALIQIGERPYVIGFCKQGEERIKIK